jgi:hypothetical protein
VTFLVIAGVLFAIGMSALIWGVVTEFRQARERGPIARVPTLPFAVQSAILVTAALVCLIPTRTLPWWAYIAAFLAQAAVGAAAILLAARAGERNRS